MDKEALARYHAAGQLDRDNPQLSRKIDMADERRREGRVETARAVVTAIGWGASVVGDYFSYKREEDRRKSEEALREERRRDREEARRRNRRYREDAPQREAEPPAVAVVAPEKKDVPADEVEKEETPRQKHDRLLKKDPGTDFPLYF